MYFTQLSIENKRGIYINSDKTINSPLINTLKNKVFKCANEANFKKNTITYYDNFKIELPINAKESIILKSMIDVDEVSSIQTDDMICSIYDEMLKIARPGQVFLHYIVYTFFNIFNIFFNKYIIY